MTEPPDKRKFPSISGPGSQESAKVPDIKPEIEGYQIIDKLGEGGMGTVWRALQLSTHREVALKVMGSGILGSQKARARFEREVELAARLQHPNVARVFESGLHHGLYYYVMELIDGKNLEDYVEQHGLTHRQILELMRSVCRAVQHAHQMGVIHRDLKPSNILVAEDGQPYVLDFGLAKIFAERDSNLTVSVDGEIVGTLPYMSPEQAAGRHDQLDTRTDVYSLGLIIYRLLTGESPYDLSGTKYAVMRRIAEEEVRRPREIDKQIDKELEVLLLKALAHEPENRYATAGDLARDIDNYLNGDPLSAKPPTTIYFLRKRIYKHRVRIVVGCLLFTVIVCTAIFVLALNRHRRTKKIQQLSAQAAKLMTDGVYEGAEQVFVAILALDEHNVEARKGINDAKGQQKLIGDLSLAKQYLIESEFDRALGVAQSAQHRFPDDPRVLKMLRQVRQAKGTATLSVKFDLGTVKKATLKKITMESGESERALSINELLSPGGIDIDPGWHWLTISYEPNDATSSQKNEISKYLLFVRRSEPYTLHARRVLVGNLPRADFTTLPEALEYALPGNIICLASGEHQLRPSKDAEFSEVGLGIPNLRIESYHPQHPSTIRLHHLYIRSTWDVTFSGLTIRGIKQRTEAHPGAIHFENSVFCKVVGCMLEDASVDAENCDVLEISSNIFSASLNFVHHRSTIGNSRRIVIRGNKVDRTRKVGHHTFSIQNCTGVLVLRNHVEQSDLKGIVIDNCSETMVVGNVVRKSFEGNIHLANTNGGLLVYNNLISDQLYNIELFVSGHATVCHNLLRGGQAGIRLLVSGNSDYCNNLIVGARTGIFCSSAAYNTLQKNIFLENDQCVAGEKRRWGHMTFESNLMDREIDRNAMQNTRWSEKNNVTCAFELEEAGESGRFHAKVKGGQDSPDLLDQDYGPALGLKSMYLACCNNIADIILEFGRLSEDLLIDKELGDGLTDKTLELANSIYSIGLPKVNMKTFGIYLEMRVAAQELKKNKEEIPSHAESFGNHHYLLYVLPMNWKEAKEFCESVGGHLATITSKEEDEWIRETFPPSWRFWLGGTDEDEEDRWEWVTGEKWQYSPWNEGEPNNQGDGEHALHIWENGNWNDGNMQEKRCFLVEWDH